MHPLSFLQKRAHLCAVARGREMFELVADMTPARFDILYLIHRNRSGPWMEQAAVTRMLGLARQTVWKMVERLVELGLITKTRDLNFHPRRSILTLTEEGRLRIREALAAAFTETEPLPRAAPAERVVPRYWKRPELADVVTANGGRRPSVKRGREVEKIYTTFFWRRLYGGRRGKRFRHLSLLDEMIELATDVARALGDTSSTVYSIRFSENHDH
ncbi:MAG: MarR family transcriptional regulator [Labilithrix sp.]|nr:MarR family transcriptional regulator [Labilithrix sp.]